ncbi:MAG TPA: glycosyl hydrolase 108 family protein [Devosiaceae bacterium]|jgi:lysozyme family protein
MPTKTDRFAAAMKAILALEGGKVDNRADPGGRTNMGITQAVYDAWRAKSSLPERHVFDIAMSEVEDIYRFRYWDAIKGDLLPAGTDLVVFDGAVNSGPSQSAKWLQRALAVSTVKIDGQIGAMTLEAVNAVEDQDALIARIIDRRLGFLKALKTWPAFGKGWMRRLDTIQAAAQAQATGSTGPLITYIAGAETKARIDDAKQAPGKGVADAATGGGIGAGGLSQVIQQAQDQLTPYGAAGGWIQRLVIGLIVAGAILAAGGLAYRWYARRKAAALNDALDIDGRPA